MTFNRDTPVTGRQAKHDKIDLTFGSWIITGTQHNTAVFFAGIEGALGPTGERWFNQNREQRFHGYEFHVRQRAHETRGEQGVPLFSGKLKARRLRAPNENLTLGRAASANPLERWSIEAELSLNPLRFVAHQRRPNDFSIPPEEWPEATLLSSEQRPLRNNEISYDGNDNLVTFHRLAAPWTSPELWPFHLDRYIGAVWSLLDGLFGTSARAAPVALNYEPNFNLRYAEVAWDFYTRDPLRVVSFISRPFLLFGVRARSRLYPIGRAETGEEFNSMAHTVRLASGVSAAVYAKTSRRVRFEIRYDLGASAAALGGSHTTNEILNVLDWLTRLSDDAAGRLNEILATMRPSLGRSTATRSVYSFLSQVFAACEDEPTFNALLAVLVHQQGIRMISGSPFRRSVATLVRRGVLARTRPHARTYIIAEEYRRAALFLHGQANEHRLELPPWRQPEDGPPETS